MVLSSATSYAAKHFFYLKAPILVCANAGTGQTHKQLVIITEVLQHISCYYQIFVLSVNTKQSHCDVVESTPKHSWWPFSVSSHHSIHSTVNQCLTNYQHTATQCHLIVCSKTFTAFANDYSYLCIDYSCLCIDYRY